MILNSPQPLARRIIAGFVLITAVVSIAFSVGIVSVVLTIEEHLVSRDLDHGIDIALLDIQNGRLPRLGADERFFAPNIDGYAPPGWLAKREVGFSEFIERGNAYYVYTKEINGQRYQIVQDQQEFETRERVLYSVVVGGCLLSIAMAWILGALIARHVMLPVTELAEAVGGLRDPRDDFNALAPAYPRDEVGDLARAFDVTIGELRASLTREKLFTSDISHELRTPLMIISSSCEVLDACVTDDKVRQPVARIGEATKEISELVETLMLLAREEANIPSTVTLAKLDRVAEEVVVRRTPEITAKGLVLEFSTSALPTVPFKDVALRTVLDNLLRNAIYYTERGTIRLTLASSGFTIEDSGIGIPLGEHQRIFEPFSRGSQARGEGLGLGLSLVKRICASQGWKIGIDSLESGGTRFSVDLLPTERATERH